VRLFFNFLAFVVEDIWRRQPRVTALVVVEHHRATNSPRSDIRRLLPLLILLNARANTTGVTPGWLKNINRRGRRPAGRQTVSYATRLASRLIAHPRDVHRCSLIFFRAAAALAALSLLFFCYTMTTSLWNGDLNCRPGTHSARYDATHSITATRIFIHTRASIIIACNLLASSLILPGTPSARAGSRGSSAV